MKANCLNKHISNERGSALVIALWVTIILSVIAFELTTTARLELRTIDYGNKRLQSRELARGAAQRAMFRLSEEKWRGREKLVRYGESGWFAPSPDSGPQKLPEIKAENTKGEEKGRWTVEITDESGKLNIDNVDEAALARLLALRGFAAPESLAGAIMRFMESRKGRSLASLDELRSIEGLDASLIYGEDTNNNGVLDPEEDDGDKTAPPDNRDGRLQTGLAVVITASPRQRISINMAPAEIVAAVLDLDAGAMKEFEKFREARGAFESLDDLKTFAWMDSKRKEKLENLFSLESDSYVIRATGAGPDGSPLTGIRASVAITPDGPVAISWQEQ